MAARERGKPTSEEALRFNELRRNLAVRKKVLDFFPSNDKLRQEGSQINNGVTIYSRFPLWPLSPGDRETHYAKHQAVVNGSIVAEYQYLTDAAHKPLQTNDVEGKTYVLNGKLRNKQLSVKMKETMEDNQSKTQLEIRLPQTTLGEFGQRVFSSWNELSARDKAMVEGTFGIVV